MKESQSQDDFQKVHSYFKVEILAREKNLWSSLHLGMCVKVKIILKTLISDLNKRSGSLFASRKDNISAFLH